VAGPLVVVVKDTWSVRTVSKHLSDEMTNDASDAFITIVLRKLALRLNVQAAHQAHCRGDNRRLLR